MMSLQGSWGIALFLSLVLVGCQQQQAAPPPEGLQPAVLRISPAAVGLILERQQATSIADPFWVRVSMPPTFDKNKPVYQMEFVPGGPKPTDYAFQADGVLCLIPKDQVDVFRNCNIDREERDGAWGFLVTNPNVMGGLPVWMP